MMVYIMNIYLKPRLEEDSRFEESAKVKNTVARKLKLQSCELEEVWKLVEPESNHLCL